MEKTPQDRNVIATRGRDPQIEDEVYRILDLKDFSSTGSSLQGDGDLVVLPPDAVTSIDNYPIYENNLQLPAEVDSLYVWGPWGIFDGTVFGWYARTLLIVTDNNTLATTADQLIAVNLDNTSEKIIVIQDLSPSLKPQHDFTVRAGSIYSGFLKLNIEDGIFEQNNTFTATLPGGQVAETTLVFRDALQTEDYFYFASKFPTVSTTDTYLCRLNKSGGFSLTVLYKISSTIDVRYEEVAAVFDTHVWWVCEQYSSFSWTRRLKKYTVSTGTSTTIPWPDYSADISSVSISAAKNAWPQSDGSITFCDQVVSFTVGGYKGLVFSNISVAGTGTIKSFILSPVNKVSGRAFKSSTNEYFVLVAETVGSATRPSILLKFTELGAASTISFVTEIFPAQYPLYMNPSEAFYGTKVRAAGYDTASADFALYETTL